MANILFFANIRHSEETRSSCLIIGFSCSQGLFGIFVSFRSMHSSVDSTGSPIHLEFERKRVDGKWLYRIYRSLRDFLMR